LKQIYEDNCLLRTSFGNVSFRVLETGKNDLIIDKWSDRLKMISMADFEKKIYQILAIDLNVTMQMLAKKFNVSKFTIYNILCNNLNK